MEVQPTVIVIKEVSCHAEHLGYHRESLVGWSWIPRRSPDSVLGLAVAGPNTQVQLTEDGHALHMLVSPRFPDRAELFLDAKCEPK